MSTTPSKHAPGPGARRRWRGPLVALGVLVALLGSLELALRAAVGVSAVRDWPLLGALGEPGNFGDSKTHDAHWEVRHRRGPDRDDRGHAKHDARLGWRSGRFAEGSLEHTGEAALDGRRPMLLFGDSFASGVWPDTVEDFPRLFARTDLAGEFALLNYGVGGYGLDQIVLLTGDALGRHRERRPVALVSLLVDDDIDRSVLSFRVWPKPRLHLEHGRLAGEQRAVPSMAQHLAQRSALEPLYLAPFLSTLWDRVDPSRLRRSDTEKRALARALLERAVADLRAAEVEFLFVLFRQGDSILDPGACGWRAELCGEVLDALEAPWVDVGPGLAAHRTQSERDTWDYFLPTSHTGAGHYNPLGNAVAFEVVREGLRQHLGLGEGGNLLLAQDVHAPGGAARAQWREFDVELERGGLRPPFLWSVFDEEGRAELRWTPRGAARALRGRATSQGGELHLECDRDGAREPLGERFELDLAQVDVLVLRAEGAPGTRLVLSEVALEPATRVAPPLSAAAR